MYKKKNAVAAQQGRIQVRTDLHQLGGRGVVGEQIQGPGNDVAAGAPPLVVFGLLAFAEDLDGGESSDLQQPGGRVPLLILPIRPSRPDSLDVVDSSICFIAFIFDFIFLKHIYMCYISIKHTGLAVHDVTVNSSALLRNVLFFIIIIVPQLNFPAGFCPR